MPDCQLTLLDDSDSLPHADKALADLLEHWDTDSDGALIRRLAEPTSIPLLNPGLDA